MAQPKGMHCLTFTLSGPKVHSPLEVMFRESVISPVYYWKQYGEKLAVSIKLKD